MLSDKAPARHRCPSIPPLRTRAATFSPRAAGRSKGRRAPLTLAGSITKGLVILRCEEGRAALSTESVELRDAR